MRIDSVRFQNFRCFEDRTFDFAERFNLIIGDNGSGKTSVLHGLSIALGSLFLGFPDPAEPSFLNVDVARTVTYWTSDKPSIQPQYPILIDSAGVIDDRKVLWERKIERAGGRTTRRYTGRLKQFAEELAERVAKNRPVTLPVLGYYGTGRRWQQKRLTKVKAISPGSRFLGYLDCLDPASDEKRLLAWFKTRELVARQKQRTLPDLEAVRQVIRACIGDTDEVYWDIAADQLAIRQGRRILWFRQLSDGYRNMLAMAADVAERCVTLNPSLEGEAVAQTPGVILIDEIDLHLHPKWQRHVVADLLRALPKIQFIATTHSPFIIQSLIPRDDVRLLNLDEARANDFAYKSIEDIAEQLQKAGVQTRSERYKAMMAAAEDYYRALEHLNETPSERMQELKDRLDELASRFSDDPAYHAILKAEREARLSERACDATR